MGATSATRSPVGARKFHYRKDISEYRETYGCALQSLYDWINDGKGNTPSELPPLDSPAEMLAWWKRNKKNRAPDRLVALAAAVGSQPQNFPESFREETPPDVPVLTPALNINAGFLAAVERHREAEANAGALYNQLARSAGERGLTADVRQSRLATAEQARRTWADLANRLREYERDAEKILAASGRTWMADDVVASVTQAHATLAAGLRMLAERVRPALTPEQVASHDAELQRLLDGLIGLKFAQLPDMPLTPAA